MNGFIKKTLATLSLAGGLSVFAGCYSSAQEVCNHCVDPCWPERYDAMAADSVAASFAPQVENGHVLDQTVWNDHFERGTPILTPAGRMHLAQLARSRPHPDSRIFLQTAYDIAYDKDNPSKFVEDRARLDGDRRVAILQFLHAQTSGRAVAFDVIVHDPGEVGMHSVPMLRSVGEFHTNFKGVLPLVIGGGGGVPR
jgi:hypothetical protein